MIKIEITQKLKNEIIKKHLLVYYDQCKDKIDAFLLDPSIEHHAFWIYIGSNLHRLLVGSPTILYKIIETIKSSFPLASSALKPKDSPLKTKLKEVFDYDGFCSQYPTKSNPDKWGAYKLTEILNVRVCPYCNRQYTVTYHPKGSDGEKTGMTRPELDHFFDKATYPYLAISLFNLIPSCKVCNSSLKGTKQFSLDKNLHPYLDGFGDDVRFTVTPKSGEKAKALLDLYDKREEFNNQHSFDIKLYPPKKTSQNPKVLKSHKNAEIFKLEQLYGFHKDIVLDLLKKYWLYNEDSINALINFTDKKLFDNSAELVEFIFGNYLQKHDYCQKTFSKFTKDIAIDIGIYDIIKDICDRKLK